MSVQTKNREFRIPQRFSLTEHRHTQSVISRERTLQRILTG